MPAQRTRKLAIQSLEPRQMLCADAACVCEVNLTPSGQVDVEQEIQQLRQEIAQLRQRFEVPLNQAPQPAPDAPAVEGSDVANSTSTDTQSLPEPEDYFEDLGQDLPPDDGSDSVEIPPPVNFQRTPIELPEASPRPPYFLNDSACNTLLGPSGCVDVAGYWANYVPFTPKPIEGSWPDIFDKIDRLSRSNPFNFENILRLHDELGLGGRR